MSHAYASEISSSMCNKIFQNIFGQANSISRCKNINTSDVGSVYGTLKINFRFTLRLKRMSQLNVFKPSMLKLKVFMSEFSAVKNRVEMKIDGNIGMSER